MISQQSYSRLVTRTQSTVLPTARSISVSQELSDENTRALKRGKKKKIIPQMFLVLLLDTKVRRWEYPRFGLHAATTSRSILYAEPH